MILGALLYVTLGKQDLVKFVVSTLVSRDCVPFCKYINVICTLETRVHMITLTRSGKCTKLHYDLFILPCPSVQSYMEREEARKRGRERER